MISIGGQRSRIAHLPGEADRFACLHDASELHHPLIFDAGKDLTYRSATAQPRSIPTRSYHALSTSSQRQSMIRPTSSRTTLPTMNPSPSGFIGGRTDIASAPSLLKPGSQADEPRAQSRDVVEIQLFAKAMFHHVEATTIIEWIMDITRPHRHPRSDINPSQQNSFRFCESGTAVAEPKISFL